jgi:hypothetical protein
MTTHRTSNIIDKEFIFFFLATLSGKENYVLNLVFKVTHYVNITLQGDNQPPHLPSPMVKHDQPPSYVGQLDHQHSPVVQGDQQPSHVRNKERATSLMVQTATPPTPPAHQPSQVVQQDQALS